MLIVAEFNSQFFSIEEYGSVESGIIDLTSIQKVISEIENIPTNIIQFSIDGVTIEKHSIDAAERFKEMSMIFVNASIDLGLLGGKGGFGAMIREKAKQKGKKVTTDFGACRDLQGRRLRHVNNEILLNKFNEAKSNNENFNIEEDTPTGIDMWYLNKPSWAEGGGNSYAAKFRRRKAKTDMCTDWLWARENDTVPENASPHWGCPRGERCNFAHGYDELIGHNKEKLDEAIKVEKEETTTILKEQYTSKLDDRLGLDLAEVVREGFRNSDLESNKVHSISIVNTNIKSDELSFDDYGF